MVITPPPRGRRRQGLVPRLIEAQGYRCAVCTHPLELLGFAEDVGVASACRLDRSLPNSYMNSVAVCRRCASTQGNYPSLLDYYRYLQTGQNKPEKDRTEYPGTAALIAAKLALHGIADRGLARPFRYAPPETVDNIVASLVYKENLRIESQKLSARIIKDKLPWGRGQKRRQLEAQNHRCAYCGERLVTNDIGSSHYATWEHVLEKRLGGTHKKNNLVMACLCCNNLREIKKLSAIDYFNWVICHRGELDIHRRNIDQKRVSKRRRAESMKITNATMKPLYSYL